MTRTTTTKPIGACDRLSYTQIWAYLTGPRPINRVTLDPAITNMIFSNKNYITNIILFWVGYVCERVCYIVFSKKNFYKKRELPNRNLLSLIMKNINKTKWMFGLSCTLGLSPILIDFKKKQIKLLIDLHPSLNFFVCEMQFTQSSICYVLKAGVYPSTSFGRALSSSMRSVFSAIKRAVDSDDLEPILSSGNIASSATCIHTYVSHATREAIDTGEMLFFLLEK